MNILFLSIGNLKNLDEKSLYPDLIRQFKKNGNNVFVVCANERRNNNDTKLVTEAGIQILRVKTGNITKVNVFEKGISTMLIESQFKSAIKAHFRDVKFDLVLYTTPPITFAGVISYIKNRDGAKTYLLLKDIFPQNAVDIGMMSKRGVKSIIYKMFRKKEKKLYSISDYIGCMSQANVDYVIRHNPDINAQKVHINPNSIEVSESEIDLNKKAEIYKRYNIPASATTFIYGGNLGKPQDIPFVIECLKANVGKADRFFAVCGTGTEYSKLKKFVEDENPDNLLLINGLAKDEYEEFASAFDVGLIFLDHRFTIPNFPSRLLSYMQNKMPTLASTDKNTDIGKVITENEFGWWCESNSVEDFTSAVEKAISADHKKLGENAFEFLEENYTSEKSYATIVSKIQGDK